MLSVLSTTAKCIKKGRKKKGEDKIAVVLFEWISFEQQRCHIGAIAFFIVFMTKNS